MLALEFLELVSDPIPRGLYIVGMRGGVERIIMLKAPNGILDMGDTNWQKRAQISHVRKKKKRQTLRASMNLPFRPVRRPRR
jgi:hypothetical protein